MRPLDVIEDALIESRGICLYGDQLEGVPNNWIIIRFWAFIYRTGWKKLTWLCKGVLKIYVYAYHLYDCFVWFCLIKLPATLADTVRVSVTRDYCVFCQSRSLKRSNGVISYLDKICSKSTRSLHRNEEEITRSWCLFKIIDVILFHFMKLSRIDLLLR